MQYTNKIYTIEELKKTLTPIFEKNNVRRAILFGSYARGDATEKSDIDIVIDSHGKLRGLEFAGVMGESEEAVRKYVDMYEVGYLKENSIILKAAQVEGSVIYEG